MPKLKLLLGIFPPTSRSQSALQCDALPSSSQLVSHQPVSVLVAFVLSVALNQLFGFLPLPSTCHEGHSLRTRGVTGIFTLKLEVDMPRPETGHGLLHKPS